MVRNKLRGRVVLQTDGQIRTGRDLAIAAMLGAEEWGVATAALVTTGCIMMRKCHLNTCPVGVATQNEELRALFTGKPEHVVNLFTFLAEELREIMAELGFRNVNEMVGQSDYLEVQEDSRWKPGSLDLSPILYKEPISLDTALFRQEDQDHGIEHVLDRTLIKIAKPFLEDKEAVHGVFSITNEDRAVGAMLSNEVSKKFRPSEFVASQSNGIHYKFRGTAGQSFAAFTAPGVTFELEGDANDYFGKGLSGARIIVYPDKRITYDPAKNIIVGNVALYGGTSGEVFIRGRAGERFAVRNSGVKAVVEGVGDHGCEYMTGGTVVVLGDTGRNFAAGMSGGVAYVYDIKGQFAQNVNMEMVLFDEKTEEDEQVLRSMVLDHLTHTGSESAAKIVKNWDDAFRNFVKVMPVEYKEVLRKRKLSEQAVHVKA